MQHKRKNSTQCIWNSMMESYDKPRVSSVQSLSHVQLFVTPWTAARQAGVYSHSCSLIRWCHPMTSTSVVPFSSQLQSFPASESFPVSHFFTSDGQSIGVSSLAAVLPMNIQDWFPLGWTGWVSLQSKGLSRVFSNTTVLKHQFFDAFTIYNKALFFSFPETNKPTLLLME